METLESGSGTWDKLKKASESGLMVSLESYDFGVLLRKQIRSRYNADTEMMPGRIEDIEDLATRLSTEIISSSKFSMTLEALLQDAIERFLRHSMLKSNSLSEKTTIPKFGKKKPAFLEGHTDSDGVCKKCHHKHDSKDHDLKCSCQDVDVKESRGDNDKELEMSDEADDDNTIACPNCGDQFKLEPVEAVDESPKDFVIAFNPSNDWDEDDEGDKDNDGLDENTVIEGSGQERSLEQVWHNYRDYKDRPSPQEKSRLYDAYWHRGDEPLPVDQSRSVTQWVKGLMASDNLHNSKSKNK